MTCKMDLLSKIDQASTEKQFPGWDCEYAACIGAMRASGFVSSAGASLVFEQIEYSFGESVIQCVAFCYATFSITNWLQVGEGVYVPSNQMNDPETGEFSIQFGNVQVTSRDRTFSVPFTRDELIKEGYLDKQGQIPTREVLLFKICDTLPKEWLYCEENYLKEVFGMDDSFQRLFVVDAWQHPSIEDLHTRETKPSQWPDIVAMVEAVCAKETLPKLTGTPNTSWRQQYNKK